MSVGYSLANITKKETITFKHLPVNTMNEICEHHVSAKLVSLYMLENLGDEISFYPDQYHEKDWPLSIQI